MDQKLPWRKSCVVYLEALFTKELLPRSLTMYPAEPTHQRSYCTIWKRVLQALSKCILKLSASNIVINSKSTVILGLIWDSRTLQASPHRIAALASCSKPETFGRLKSFIGACKVLARVIPQFSALLVSQED